MVIALFKILYKQNTIIEDYLNWKEEVVSEDKIDSNGN